MVRWLSAKMQLYSQAHEMRHGGDYMVT